LSFEVDILGLIWRLFGLLFEKLVNIFSKHSGHPGIISVTYSTPEKLASFFKKLKHLWSIYFISSVKTKSNKRKRKII
jgi:hypothetical protein